MTPTDTPDPQQHGPHMPQDEAFARLSAADPAAGISGDPAAIRAATERKLASDDAGAGTASDTGKAPATVVPLDSRRRNRTRAVMAAAAAVALVAVGAGGYALGNLGQATTEVLPPISMSGSGQSGQGATTEMAAGGAAAPRAADAATYSSYPGWGWGARTVFTASGLDTSTGTATAYTFDTSGKYSTDNAARVAAALGVTADPVTQDGWISVGSQDGTGPSVSLYPDATVNFGYYNPAAEPYGCAIAEPAPQPSQEPVPESSEAPASEPATPGSEPATPGSEPATPSEGTPSAEPETQPAGEPATPTSTPEPTTAAGSSDSSASDPDTVKAEQLDPTYSDGEQCEEPNLGPAPGKDDAIAKAKTVLTALGQNPGDFAYSTDSYDEKSITVTADRVIDGQAINTPWYFSFSGAGLQNASGYLATPVSLGTYPVVSAAAALDRLSDPRFGVTSSGVVPLSAAARGGGETVETMPYSPPTAPPEAPAAGATIPWPVTTVQIVSARLGVALVFENNGSAILVPAYEFANAEGYTWSVIAVDESKLDFTSS